MFGKLICACGTLFILFPFALHSQNNAAAQDELKPLHPNDPRLTFSFPIPPQGNLFRFKVEIDESGEVTGVSVFHAGDSMPFQRLHACKSMDLSQPVNEEWGGYTIDNLLKHEDLNFDGFEDLELLQYDIPHLDKKYYCIYLWDNKAGRFNYSPELTGIGVNLETHPESKTLTTREDWQGGAWQEDTYRWNSGKLELIEEESLLGDWSNPNHQKCGFSFICKRLVKGEMVTTSEIPVCTAKEMDNLPVCPATDATHKPKALARKPHAKKKD